MGEKNEKKGVYVSGVQGEGPFTVKGESTDLHDASVPPAKSVRRKVHQRCRSDSLHSPLPFWVSPGELKRLLCLLLDANATTVSW